ncbi:MAG TPA: DUF429 domain-containing protein [Anaeromyxobacteraceae bacterium]|nr:DUF429 domain-containing protein [Anaeromyxobacteraceae bacterium]
MASESEVSGSSSAVWGRAPPAKVVLPQRGFVLGMAFSGIEGAGNQIVTAKIECTKSKPKLVQVSRPFQDAPGRRDVREQFPGWLAEEAKWAEGRLALGLDFPFSLSETHLRQLGLLRQALRGPASLGRGLEERFLGTGDDFSAAAEAFRGELGRDRIRLADCYRANPYPPSHQRCYRQTFFGLLVLARLSEVSFVPWDPPKAGRPALVEVRPEHVARVVSGTCAYRDDARDGLNRSSARASLLRTLRTASGLEFEMELAAKVVEDEKGLFLDAVLAAVAAAAAQEVNFQGVPSNVPRSEGWIYSVREEPWREN